MTKQENEERLARLKNIVLSMPESQEATNITTKIIRLYMWERQKI